MLKSRNHRSQRQVSRLLQRLLRNTYAVENLEQRILLSADPVTALTYSVLDEPSSVEYAAPSYSASQETSQADALEQIASFNVDPQAIDAALIQTRSAFLDSALASQDSNYARFMEGVLSQDVLTVTADQLPLPNADQSLSVLDVSQSSIAASEPTAPKEVVLQDGLFDLRKLADQVNLTDAKVLVVSSGAKLGGSGTFDGSLVVTDGILSPGYSPGVQNEASLTMSASASVLFELGGATPGTGAGHYDQINVSGLATLNGQVAVSLYGGYVPQDGDTFTILTYGSYSGGFASSSGLLDVGNGLFFELMNIHSVCSSLVPVYGPSRRLCHEGPPKDGVYGSESAR